MKFKLGNTVVVTEPTLASHLIETGHSIMGKIISTKVTPSYLVEFKFVADSRESIVKYTVKEQDLAKLAEEVTIEHKHTPKEKQGFSSQQEIWEYLIAGGEVQSKVTNAVLLLQDGKVFSCTGTVAALENITFSNFEFYTKHTEPKWKNRLISQNIICRVWDIDGDQEHNWIAIIEDYKPEDNEPYKEVDGETSWGHAEPLTQEEVNKLIYKG